MFNTSRKGRPNGRSFKRITVSVVRDYDDPLLDGPSHISEYPLTAPAGLTPEQTARWNELYYRTDTITRFVDGYREGPRSRNFSASKDVMIDKWNSTWGKQAEFNEYHTDKKWDCLKDRCHHDKQELRALIPKSMAVMFHGAILVPKNKGGKKGKGKGKGKGKAKGKAKEKVVENEDIEMKDA